MTKTAKCGQRIVAPCQATGADVIFGTDPDVSFGGEDVEFGAGGVCPAPAIVTACTMELLCDDDLPAPVFRYPVLSSENDVEMHIEGLGASYQLEILIKEKYDIGGQAFPITTIKALQREPDLAAPAVVIVTLTDVVDDGKIYTASVRRVDDEGICSPWSYDLFIGSSQVRVLIVDGTVGIIDDDGETVIVDG